MSLRPSEIQLIVSELIQPPQHFRLLLQGLSASHNERIVQDRQEVGFGIIRLLKDYKGVLMRPTLSIGDPEFWKHRCTESEYTYDYGYVYDIKRYYEMESVVSHLETVTG